MDSAEISRTTRLGMIFIGLLQGALCYLLMTYLVPHNDGWLFYGMPATIANHLGTFAYCRFFQTTRAVVLDGADLCCGAGDERLAKVASRGQ